MKWINILAAVVILAACNNNANVENAETENPSDEMTQTEETTAPVEEVKTSKELLLGTWVFEDPKINITQIITYNADGTYALKMGEMDISGTWELNDSTLITKSRPDAPGQKKTITQIDDSTLTTFWEPKGGKGRELVYKRQ